MRAAVEEGGHTSADGPFTAKAAELLRAEVGASDVLLTTSCTAALEMSALLLDLGPGDTGGRAVVRVRDHRVGLRAPGGQGAVLRHRRAHPRPRSAPPRRADGPVGPRGRAHPLRRDRLRRRRHPSRPGRVAASRARGGQRPRPLRASQRRAPRELRPLRHPQLPRDEELHLRRGRGAHRQPGRGRRAGARALPQGHQPPGVPARSGRQVLVAGRRIVVRARRRARRVPLRAAPAARPRSSPSGVRSSTATSACSNRTPSASGYRLPEVPDGCEQAYHMFYVLLPDEATRNRALDRSRREASTQRSTTCRSTAHRAAVASRREVASAR